ncbi:hypothetical protein Sste5346_007285 [Sporothrix stenoceras]|uniref:Alpha/beta hydrolase fold-3 domain-containing protein n=1 Tax=Sporothrix stenoceras TaxID=5173 RepID=A0ABR3YVM9_9PEZI
MPLELDPELAAVLAVLSAGYEQPPPPALGDVATRRATVGEGIRHLSGPTPDGVTTTDYFATAADGHKILLRLYQPESAKSDDNLSPLLYYIHGGGMILGSVDIYNSIVAKYAVQTGVPFLSVDYRLAPEHPYPTPVDDCCAGLAWLAEHTAELGVAADRVAIMGDSGGGGLAMATTLRLRERKCQLTPSMLILLAPMLDDRTVEADKHLEKVVSWSGVDNQTGWMALLGSLKGEDVPATASPARMTDEDLGRLPPMYMDVGALDLFRDETVQLASRATKAGVSVELHVYPGCTHGFDLFAPRAGVSQQAVANRIRAIERWAE